jgi:thiol-disulfide isomerase/thioredoxin
MKEFRRSRRRALWRVCWLSLACALCACGGDERPRTSRFASKPGAATPAADDGLVAIDGPGLLARIRNSGAKGTVVNVWASFCGPCKRELPMLVQLAEPLRAEGLALVLVSADEPAARKAAADVLASLAPRPSAPNFIVAGSLAPFKRALNPAWKGAIPSTFLFDAEARLRYFWPGPVLEHEITNVLSAFLAGRELEGPTYVEPDPPAQ